MTTLHNEILIVASIDKVWEALTQIEMLEKFDPTVLRSVATTATKSGLGAKRKVTMRDGKNWFEEEVTAFHPKQGLGYSLKACSFPINDLRHTYIIASINETVRVQQTMEYTVKWGILGRIMDALMIKGQTDKGIKMFLAGLKSYLESN